MEYNKNGQILREFYARHDLTDCFERDNTYLESAFDEINRIWFDNLYKIDEVNYLMIAEAPLWGKSKSYIYTIHPVLSKERSGICLRHENPRQGRIYRPLQPNRPADYRHLPIRPQHGGYDH